MAPRRSSAAAAAPAAKKLTPGMLLLWRALVPVCAALFLLGAAGLAVLLDTGRTQWYSATQFAATWRWLTRKNPMVTAACFNGGMVGLALAAKTLLEHRRAGTAEGAARRKTRAAKAQ